MQFRVSQDQESMQKKLSDRSKFIGLFIVMRWINLELSFYIFIIEKYIVCIFLDSL